MKINNFVNISSKPSFGLRIQKDAGFNSFVERAGGEKWNCPKEDILQFIQKLEDMHFSQEGKDDTSIIFGQATKQIEGYRAVPSITYRNKFVNEPIYTTVLPCSFHKTKNPDEETMGIAIKLNGSTLDDVLREIASGYAQYMYSKK